MHSLSWEEAIHGAGQSIRGLTEPMAVRGDPPAISVCIPVWNDSHWLPGAIESVVDQTYSNWELVISDNASDEDLGSIVARYADPRIAHRRWDDHVSVYESHNRAMWLCRSEWVLPLGSDDRMQPHCLTTMAERIAELAARGVRPSMVISPCRRVDESGKPADRRYYGSQGVRKVADGLYEPGSWFRVMIAPGAPPWNIGSVTFSTLSLVDAGGAFRPEVGLSADNELVLRLSAYGPVAYCDRPLLDFTVRSDSDGNVRFAANRSSGDPQTPMGAALLSGFEAHEARGHVGPDERKELNRAVARFYLQRAGQHRILSGGRGRSGALADTLRAVRRWPGLLVAPSQLVRALGIMVAPTGLLAAASARMSARSNR